MVLCRRHLLISCSALALVACADTPELAPAADDTSLASLPVRVLMTQGFAEVHGALAPQLMVPTRALTEAGNGSVPAVATGLGPHLQEGHSVDVVVAPRAVMVQLQGQGLVRRDSLVDLVRTPLTVVVAAGRPVPKIQTPDDVRALLLSTVALAYPSSDGSAFIEQKLLPQLGIKNDVLPKSIKVFGPQVAALVARGDASLGLQALSEYTSTSGVTLVGPLPAPLDYATVYTAGIATHAASAAGAHALLRFYRREVAAYDWLRTGFEAVVLPDASTSAPTSAPPTAPAN